MKEFLTIKELSDYLNMRKSTLYSMVENREIPFFRFGKLIRFKKQEIDIWIESHKEKTINVENRAKKILKGATGPRMDVDKIIKKAVDEAKGKRYTSGHGRPDQDKGLRKEVEDGTL